MVKKSFEVLIKSEWCKSCGLCIALCPVQVLTALPSGKAQVSEQAGCIGCKSCVLHCPDFCIEIKEL